MSKPEVLHSAVPLVDNRRAAVEALFSALAFATMSTIVHGFGDKIAWPVVAFVRILITFVIIFTVLRIKGAPLIIRGNRVLWIRSLVGSSGLFFTFYALTHMYVTDAVTIIATNPIWIMVILAVFFNHRLPWVVIFDVILAIAGVLVMERPTFNAEILPMLAAMLGAITSAIVKVSLSRLGGLPTVSVVTHHSAVSTVTTLLASLFIVDTVVLAEDLNPAIWLLLIPVGLLGTVAQLYMTSSYGRGNTLMVTLVSLSSLAFAALYDVLFWDRTFDLFDALGASMIATAIVLSVTRAAREAAAAPSDPEVEHPGPE